LGLVLLVACPATFVHTQRFIAGAERTTGTVIDLSRQTDSDGTVTFNPIVRFTTADGRTVQFVSSSSSSSPPDLGDTVDVLYDPDDPRGAQLSGFFDLWLFPLVFGGVGIAFTAVGLFAPGFGLLAGCFGLDRFAESS
jgi:hypothetical protein